MIRLLLIGLVLQQLPGFVATNVDPAIVAFGYTDSTGSKLLTLSEDNRPIDESRAKAMVAAVCSDGREFQIRYVQFQKSSPASNGRQSAGNFSNDQGQLFEIVQGKAEPGDTCLLVPAGYLQAFPISRNELRKAERVAPFRATTEFAKASLARIERDKARTAKVYWPLHRHGASEEVAVIEFEPMGDSLLGSLVLADTRFLSFFDMPARLKEGRARGGCWRVDDDCRLNYEEMNVSAVLGEPGRRLVFFTTWGPEGQSIVLFQAKDARLVELRRGYRYHSPL